MSKEKADLESGRSRSRSRTQAPQADSRAPNRPPDYFNYHPPVNLLLIEIQIVLILGIVCFLSPSSSGGLSSVVKSDSEYIGVLKSCSDTACQAFMAAGSSSDSSNAGSSKRHLTARADLTSSIDLSNLFLTTGLAALASFWLMLYLFLFTLFRFFSAPPPLSDDDEDRKSRSMWDIRDGLKRYAYRVSRIYVVVEGVLVLGVACAAAWTYNEGRQNGGSLGIGVLLLHFCWPQLFACAYVELARGKWRKRMDLGWCACSCLPLFQGSKRRARIKWAKNGDEGDDKAASGSRSRTRSKSRRSA